MHNRTAPRHLRNRKAHSRAILASAAALALAVPALLISAESTIEIPAIPSATPLPALAASRQAVVPSAATPERIATTQPDAAGFYHAPVGRCFHFGLRADLGAATGSAEESPKQEMRFRIEGSLTTTIVARRADELVAEWSLTGLGVEAEIGGRSVEELANRMASELALPFFVRLGDDGRTLGFRFPEGARPEYAEWMRTLVGAARLVVPENHDREWTTEERSSLGSVSCRYLRDEDRLIKQQIGFATVSPDGVQPEIAGRCEAKLDPTEGWFRTAHATQNITVRIDGTSLRQTHELAVHLATAAVPSRREVAEFDWNVEWAPAIATGAPGTIDTEATDRAGLADLLEGATVERLIVEIRDLLAADPVDMTALFMAREKLAQLLHMDPERMQKMRGYVLEMARDERLANVVLSSVGATQLPEAQQLLANFAGRSGLANHLRVSSTLALGEIHRPTRELMTVVRRMAGAQSGSKMLDRANTLLLGILSAREQDASDVDSFAALAGLEKTMLLRGEIGTWLAALGNSLDARLVPLASRYLGHVNLAVRSDAIAALTHVPGSSATMALVNTLKSDRDPTVRAKVAAALGARSDEVAVDAVARILREEPAAAVRRAVLVGMTRNPSPTARMAEWVAVAARSDASSGVRELARQMLGRK